MSHVQDQFRNWQTNPLQPDPRRCSDIGQSWMRFLLARWGGQNLGCYTNRPVVGGSSLSSHASGAAIDWRYQDPGPGRARMLNEVMPYLTYYSRVFGIQAIHDYVASTIWRPPGQSGRPTSPSPQCGWRDQAHGSQMGQPWALWLHIECVDTRWGDTRSVEQMIADDLNRPPDPDEDDDMIFDGLWKRENHDAIFAIYKNGTKVWITDMGHLNGMQNLQAINGATPDQISVRTMDDPGLFAAFGLVIGPVPAGCDSWGNFVG